MDYHLLVNLFTLVLLPILVFKLFTDILDAWKYYNRKTDIEPVYMSDLFDLKTRKD